MVEEEIPLHESTRRRRRWGCTCGCIGLLGLLVVVALGFSWYMVKSLPKPAREAWVNANTDGYGILALDMSDEGVSDMVRLIFKRIEARRMKSAPENERQAIKVGMTVARQFLGTMFYPEVLIHITTNKETGEESPLLVMGMRSRLSSLLVNMALGDTKSAAGTADLEGGGRLFRLSDTGQSMLAVVGPTIMLADTRDAAQRAATIAATGNRPANAGPTDTMRQYISELDLNRPEEGRDVSFAAVMPAGRIVGWLKAAESKLGVSGASQRVQAAAAAHRANLDDILAMTATGDITSADRVKLNATMYCRTTDAAKRLAETLKLALNQMFQRTEQTKGGLTGKVDVKPLGTTISVGLEINGLKALIEALLPV